MEISSEGVMLACAVICEDVIGCMSQRIHVLAFSLPIGSNRMTGEIWMEGGC